MYLSEKIRLTLQQVAKIGFVTVTTVNILEINHIFTI